MVFNNSKNFYDVLGVEIDANSDQIRIAYRKLARKYHPDVNKTENAEEIFKEITNAYNTLCDPTERNRYNILKGIFKETEKKVHSQDLNHDEFKKSTEEKQEKKEPYTKTINKEEPKKEKGKKPNFSLLKTLKAKILLFKRQQNHKKTKKPQKGENINTEVIISPEEVIMGGKRVINIRTTKACPQCTGRRFVNEGKCPKCNGSGEITETKKITVTIPKGVKNGAKLRLKGEGASGKNGGPNGDLYISIKVEAKSGITYDKLNIYYNVPVTPFEAALGEEIIINTFNNEKIKFKLPKNTSSGQKFRFANQGIKKNGKVGDLIVTVSIEFSHDLSEDEVKLYQELKNLSKDNVRENFGYGS